MIFKHIANAEHETIGTALYSIFERLDYTDEKGWDMTLPEASEYFLNIIRERNLPLFRQMISHIMNTEIC